MYNFSIYTPEDLIKIRDALEILLDFYLADEDLLHAVRDEIEKRKKVTK